MSDDILIKADHVGKKFCRTLKRSLWYGVTDILQELVPWRPNGLYSPGQAASDEAHLPDLRQGEFWALQDVSFELRRGECLGLIGHNGAGKSTLLKILNGLIKPDTGRLEMRGRVGALIELGAGFNPILTGRENIYNKGAVLGFTKREIDERFDAIIDFAEIGDFIDMPVQNYSSGMKVRLGFAVSAQMEPDVLIIDEVLAVGDVSFRVRCYETIARLLQNSAVIFVSHAMPQIYRIADQLMMLQSGSVRYHGTDVAHGIAEYFSLSHTGEINRHGTGAVQLEGMSLKCNGDEKHLGEELAVTHGADLEMSFDFCIDESVSVAMVQVVFWNQELHAAMNVIGEGGKGALMARRDRGVHRLVGVLRNLSLNAGIYSLSLIVTDPDNLLCYCQIDNLATLNVKTCFVSGANTLVVADWQATKPSALDK